MIHSASSQSRPAVKICIVLVDLAVGTDGRTTCVNIVITIGRENGRPRGSIRSILQSDPQDSVMVCFVFRVAARFCDENKENDRVKIMITYVVPGAWWAIN